MSSKTWSPSLNAMEKFVDLRCEQSLRRDMRYEIDDDRCMSPTRCPACRCCYQNRALRSELYKQREMYMTSEQKKNFLVMQLEEALYLLERHCKACPRFCLTLFPHGQLQLSSALQKHADKRTTNDQSRQEDGEEKACGKPDR
eukprot:750128-Hanusia_phi.AAC.4